MLVFAGDTFLKELQGLETKTLRFLFVFGRIKTVFLLNLYAYNLSAQLLYYAFLDCSFRFRYSFFVFFNEKVSLKIFYFHIFMLILSRNVKIEVP